MEKNVYFESENYKIHGLLDRNSDDKGIIVTHPHPLYGGDMFNPVVNAIVKAYLDKGYTTLRFNFRGTGKSEGAFGDGVGEANDVRAAIRYFHSLGIDTVDVAGYSFGAWVNSKAGCDAIREMVMVSPPIGMIEFDEGLKLPCLKLVVTGSRDDIAPVSVIEKNLPLWNPEARFEIIDGVDHFYSGGIEKLKALLPPD